ncbi:MAG: hypothetical protein KCHDKBKB_00758 [Elusimicrobia bacterium]|nr:hypothetical protein [Elusimicrobiota bacterium]
MSAIASGTPITANFINEALQNAIGIPPNPYHPLVWILGKPKIGKGVYIGGFSEVNANESSITIGDNCDIGSFVVINCADSHRKTIGASREVERLPIIIGNNVFIGTQSAILGGCKIGHHSVIAAGCILKNAIIPPMSLVLRDGTVKKNYYKKQIVMGVITQ